MSELFLLKNSEVIDLFEIKINDFEGYFRFHGSKNFNKDIVFQDQTYIYIPSEISNLEYSSDAKQNRPTLIISNINNFITNFIKDRNDLLGKRFYRKKILAKDLDDVNFGGANRNTLGGGAFKSFIASDTYIIHRKNYETKEKVEFSLANILDLEGITIPARKVYNDFCSWQYRGCGCNYGKIYGYEGPTVETNITPYTSLTQINTEDPNNNISGNLLIWLRPEGIVEGSDIYMQRVDDARVPSSQREILKFKKVNSWTNEGVSAVSADFLSTNPKKILAGANSSGYVSNAGRMNNQAGVYLSVDFTNTNYYNPVADKLKLALNLSSSDVTIIYVAEMVNYKYKPGTNPYTIANQMGGVQGTALTNDMSDGGNRWWMGWEVAQRDGKAYAHRYNSCRLPSGTLIADGPANANNLIKKPFIHSLVYPLANTKSTKFYSNGSIVRSLALNNGVGPRSFIFNQTGYTGYPTTSEIVIYEMIVYDKVLDDETVNKIHSYLGAKYNIAVPKQYTRTTYKKGSAFFGKDDGNLGVPVADENNKIFLKSYAENSFRLSNFESYNLLSMQYKTGYNPDYNYQQGDFIKIDPYIEYDFNEKSINQNNELPTRFFVCVDPDGSKGKHPLNYTNVWVEDKCSRNLNGCSLRFNDPVVNIPFGGFPGTVGYDYKLPSS